MADKTTYIFDADTREEAIALWQENYGLTQQQAEALSPDLPKEPEADFDPQAVLVQNFKLLTPADRAQIHDVIHGLYETVEPMDVLIVDTLHECIIQAQEESNDPVPTTDEG